MTRVEGTSYVSVARDSMQTQFFRFSFKTKNHDRPETASGEEVKSISPADAVAQVSADVFHKLPVSVFIFVR